MRAAPAWIAGRDDLEREAGGRGRGAGARAAADAQRGHPPRQHRRAWPRSWRWPSGSAPSGSSWRTRSTSAGRWRTATRCCRARRAARARPGRGRAPRASGCAGEMEILFVPPDYYADRPRACMDGWARRYIVVTPDGLVLPCHAGARASPGWRSRASAIGRSATSGATRRRCARSAARPGCRRRAGPATSAHSTSAAAAARRSRCWATRPRPTRPARSSPRHDLVRDARARARRRSRRGAPANPPPPDASPGMNAAIEVERPRQDVRRGRGGPRHRLLGRGGRDFRLPRAERRGQDHHHQDPVHAAAADVGARAPRRHGRRDVAGRRAPPHRRHLPGSRRSTIG